MAKRKAEPGYVYDWATRAAEHIDPKDSVQRIASVIATFAAPLVALLKESRREHKHVEVDLDAKQCCSQCTCESWSYVERAQDGGELDAENEPNSDEPCTCGADAWNAKIDKVLQ